MGGSSLLGSAFGDVRNSIEDREHSMRAVPATTQLPNPDPYGGSIASIYGADVFNRSIYDPVSTQLDEPRNGANQERGPPTYDTKSNDVKYPASYWVEALPDVVKQEGRPPTYDTESDEDKSVDKKPASDWIEETRNFEVLKQYISDFEQQMLVARKHASDLLEAVCELKKELYAYNTKSDDVEPVNKPPLSEGSNACVDGAAENGGNSNKDDAETKEGDTEWSSKSTRRRVRGVTTRQPRLFQRQVIGRSRVQRSMREGKRLLSARALRQLE